MISFVSAIATLAGMATVIGIFNGWPAHETIGSFVVLVVFGSVAFIAAKRSQS